MDVAWSRFSRACIAVLTVGFALAGCGGDGGEQGGAAKDSPTEVKIGVLMPTSGAQADYGTKLKNAAQFAADEINAAGGIKSLGGAKIMLLITDTQAQPEVGQAATQRLILRDKVTGLIGCYNSTVTIPCTAVAEKNRTPIVVYSAIAPEITTRGFKYTFRPNETATGSVDTMVGFFKEQADATGKSISSYALVFENTDFGKSTGEAFDAAAKEFGWEKKLEQTYSPGTADVTPIAVQLKSAKPDLILTVGNQPDTNTVYKTFNQQGVKAPVMIDYAGAASDSFNALLSKNDGLFSLTQWDASVASARPWLKEHIDGFIDKYGEPPQPEGLQAYSDVYIWAAALEQAGSTDKAKLRDALASLTLEPDSENAALIMPYASIRFGEDGQNPDASMMITQASNGKRVPVYPESSAADGYEVAWMSGE
jgi:branched-chain amino acid transport system substrate-binding protein